MAQPLKISPRADPSYLAALGEVLGKLAESLARDSRRRARDRPCLYLAGGAAAHLYTGARLSNDIDAALSARVILRDDLRASYRGPDGRARLLYFDTQYNESFGLVHERAHDDARPVRLAAVDPAILEVRALAPVDLAVSKLARYAAQDVEDIRALAQAGLVAPAAVRRRAREALGAYVGDTASVKTSIELACKLIAQTRRGASRGGARRRPRRARPR